MAQQIFKTLSYISMFTLGLYASSQFKHGEPVADYRWLITLFCFITFIILSSKNK